jgi:hypothetical protein
MLNRAFLKEITTSLRAMRMMHGTLDPAVVKELKSLERKLMRVYRSIPDDQPIDARRLRGVLMDVGKVALAFDWVKRAIEDLLE